MAETLGIPIFAIVTVSDIIAYLHNRKIDGRIVLEVQHNTDLFDEATQVDGVYSADPKKDPSAELIPEIGYQEALERQLKVMDSTAFSLCADNGMPIHVFNMGVRGNIVRVLRGESVGSVVR